MLEDLWGSKGFLKKWAKARTCCCYRFEDSAIKKMLEVGIEFRQQPRMSPVRSLDLPSIYLNSQPLTRRQLDQQTIGA